MTKLSRHDLAVAAIICRGIAPAIKEQIAREVAELSSEIAILKSRPAMVYRGIWQAGVRYQAGDAVTRSGSLWVAERETSQQPGGPDDGWRLVAKGQRS